MINSKKIKEMLYLLFFEKYIATRIITITSNIPTIINETVRYDFFGVTNCFDFAIFSAGVTTPSSALTSNSSVLHEPVLPALSVALHEAVYDPSTSVSLPS